MTTETEILATMDPDLWGILTTGTFLTVEHEAKAAAWIALCVNAHRNPFHAAGVVIAALDQNIEADKMENTARLYRFRVVNVLEGVTKHLRLIVLDFARTAWVRGGVPEPPPRIHGGSNAAQMGRTRYAALRYFNGNESNMSMAAGLERSYIRSLVRREGSPSEQFLIGLSHCSGISLDWLVHGSGSPKAS